VWAQELAFDLAGMTGVIPTKAWGKLEAEEVDVGVGVKS